MVLEDLMTVLAEVSGHTENDSTLPAMISRASGENVIVAGDVGKNMFVIQSGEAEILRDGVVFDVVGPGGIVGEMALVDGSNRSATVRARSDLNLMPISKSHFELLIRHHPEFGLFVMKIMSLRLRLMNARLGDAMGDISERQKIERELRLMATRDPLTGISNRRHFNDMATREIELSQRHGRKLSIAILDVDHFKKVNDTYGHACGDNVLRLIVEVMAAELRSADIFGRMGGEEFALLLPETELDAASVIAERIRTAIAGQIFNWDGKTFGITVSIGVANWVSNEPNIEPALARADKGLYEAKKQGRDRVITRTS